VRSRAIHGKHKERGGDGYSEEINLVQSIRRHHNLRDGKRNGRGREGSQTNVNIGDGGADWKQKCKGGGGLKWGRKQNREKEKKRSF